MKTGTMTHSEMDGLKFFGRMSAAISHDLKNTLSIMNESAGLIEDLALLAQKGRALDPIRIHQLGATIKRQIQRNDGIVRNMNRFAHSVDEPVKEIGLPEWLEVLLTICRRLTDARGVTVSIEPCDSEVSIVTRPFFLLQLVWSAVEWSMNFVGGGKRVTIEIRRTPRAVQLAYHGLERLSQDTPSPQWHDLLMRLQADLKIEDHRNGIVIGLPLRIDA